MLYAKILDARDLAEVVSLHNCLEIKLDKT